ncbi:two-component system response regulator [Nostocales cyanobacterium HT-58-2]|nr:two-component system response regulator [Nostocales cyanobacterium HT-58-2]
MSHISAFPVRQTPPVLIVEDSNEDFEALQRFLQRSPFRIPIQRCVNGEQALAFLYRTGSYSCSKSAPRPGLIVLDLNLPGTDGREVLRRLKQDDNLKSIPVVVFTTSNNPKDIEDCYQYGVNSYIVKPIDFEQLKRNMQTLIDYWFKVTMLPYCYEDYS